jgi:hypothetical protein
MTNLTCDVIQWGASTDREKVPATSLLWKLPNDPGEERERMIRDFALRGDVPAHLQVWCPVPVTHEGLTGEFYCTPDFLSIGSDDDWVRVRINPVTAELIGEVAKAMLPTRKMVNDIYVTSKKLAAQSWGPPYDHSMMCTHRWAPQDARINQQIQSKGYERGELIEGHAKNVVIGLGLGTNHGQQIGIYGWFDESGTAIQGPGVQWKAHEWSYTDYSQCVRFVHKEMLVGDEVMRVEDVLADSKLHKLISDEGPLSRCFYSAFHTDYLKG